MDYLYGKLNKEVEKVNYIGGDTDTATVRVSKDDEIYVDVKCSDSPESGIIVKYTDRGTVQSNGPEEDLDVTNKEYVQTELDKKANIDGYYEDMTVGNAIMSKTIARDPDSATAESFSYRATGGTSNIAYEAPAIYNNVRGQTWCENQLVQYGASQVELGAGVYLWINKFGNVVRFTVASFEVIDVDLGDQVIDLGMWTMGQADTLAHDVNTFIQNYGRVWEKAIPYNPNGTIKTLRPIGVLNTNVNLWDEEYNVVDDRIESKNRIRILPDRDTTQYHIGGPQDYDDAPTYFAGVIAYDNRGNVTEEFEVPLGATFQFSNSKSVEFSFSLGTMYGTTYNHDIIINIVYVNYAPQKYVPHNTSTFQFEHFGLGLNRYDTSWIEEKIESGVRKYYQYVQRRSAVISLDTLDWEYVGDNTYRTPNNFITHGDAWIDSGVTFTITTEYIIITSDTEDFKSASLWYQTDPITEIYEVNHNWSCLAWDLGTEELIFDNDISAGANISTLYAWNANDALRNMVSKLDIVHYWPDNWEDVPMNKVPDALLVYLSTIGIHETFTISNWQPIEDASPYTYQATVESLYVSDGDAETTELINDNAVLFAQYGFAIGSAGESSITFYSIGEPSGDVTLEVKHYYG